MNKLELIRKNLERNIGRNIAIKFNRGRQHKCVANGFLENTYQSIFVVRLTDNVKDKVMSFTYADVFTKNIDIIFENEKKVSNQ